MTEQRAYAALVTTVDRKAKELLSYIDKEDINTRIVKSKHDKLLSDLAEVKKLVVAYISTLTTQATITKVYDKQGELFERVNKALEGACEAMELEEFKVDLLEKARRRSSMRRRRRRRRRRRKRGRSIYGRRRGRRRRGKSRRRS